MCKYLQVRNIAGDVDRGVLGRRLLTSITVGFADSLTNLNLAAAGTGAFAVGLSEALVVASLSDVIGGIALGLAWGTLDLLVTVGITSGPNVTGNGFGASLGNLIAPSAAYHNLSACIVELVGTKLTVHACDSEGRRWVREVQVVRRRIARPKDSHVLPGEFLDAIPPVDAVALVDAAVDELL